MVKDGLKMRCENGKLFLSEPLVCYEILCATQGPLDMGNMGVLPSGLQRYRNSIGISCGLSFLTHKADFPMLLPGKRGFLLKQILSFFQNKQHLDDNDLE